MRTYLGHCAAVLLAGTLLLIGPAVAARAQNNQPAPAQPPAQTSPLPRTADARIIADFVAAVRADKALADATRQAMFAAVTDCQKDPDRRGEAITQALTKRYPAFAEALITLADEKTAAAIAQLTPLATANDPYLAANAAFYLARARVNDRDFEVALPLLEKLVNAVPQRTLHRGAALFLLGVTQQHLLQRRRALNTLKTFLAQYPDASERMVVGAKNLIAALSLVKDGSLSDVQERMNYSQRRLALQDSGTTTQQEQDRIIAMLDKLIKEAQDKENSGGGGSSSSSGGASGSAGGPAAGNQQPTSPATQSTAPVGPARIGALHRVMRGGENDSWNKVRNTKRGGDALAALKENFPERYRQLVEQYYKSMQSQPSNAGGGP